MKITDFEKEIQEDIDSELSIRINPNHEDIAGVYYKDFYLGVAVPPQEIREEFDRSYVDSTGYPYKHKSLALEFIKGKLEKTKKAMEEDPDLFVDEK